VGVGVIVEYRGFGRGFWVVWWRRKGGLWLGACVLAITACGCGSGGLDLVSRTWLRFGGAEDCLGLGPVVWRDGENGLGLYECGGQWDS
jgi:hypothetical protein